MVGQLALTGRHVLQWISASAAGAHRTADLPQNAPSAARGSPHACLTCMSFSASADVMEPSTGPNSPIRTGSVLAGLTHSAAKSAWGLSAGRAEGSWVLVQTGAGRGTVQWSAEWLRVCSRDGDNLSRAAHISTAAHIHGMRGTIHSVRHKHGLGGVGQQQGDVLACTLPAGRMHTRPLPS